MTPDETLRADEERFDQLLMTFDEALEAGVSPHDLPIVNVPPYMEERLRQVRACLSLFRDGRPRPNPSKHTSLPLPNPPSKAIANLPLRIGRFAIVRELGRGGFGIVYLAEDTRLNRRVALKVPRPEVLLTPAMQRRFVHEGLAAALLDHVSIVPVYEAGAEGPICYIASAFCPGSSLAAWLRNQHEPVNLQEAARLVARLADAVAYMHQRGVLHRDLKPANILLQSGEASGRDDDLAPDTSLPVLPLSSYVPRITDFGLALSLDGEGNETETGVPLGTALYMSPEQAEGRRDAVGPPTDVYALGVILYELLAVRLPFKGESTFETLRQVCTLEPPSIRAYRQDVSPDLAAICFQCLAKAPGSRYPTAAALAEDLRRFLNGKPTLARPLSRWQQTVRGPAPTGHRRLGRSHRPDALDAFGGWALAISST